MKTHILLVDDDIDEMKIFVEALKEVIPPFKCTYASNAVHALKMLLYLKPEAIFVDYNMPVMNGLEFIEKVKSDVGLRSVPLFLYSTHISPDNMTKAEHLGIAGYIEKPSSVNGLTRALKEVLTVSV